MDKDAERNLNSPTINPSTQKVYLLEIIFLEIFCFK